MHFRVKKGWKLVRMLFVATLILGWAGLASAELQKDHAGHKNPAVDRPAWLDKLENQLNHEDLMSGLEGSQKKLDKTFMGLMGRLQDKLN